MNKKILIVVDYQNDFINGVLGFKEAVEIKPFIINKIKEYQKRERWKILKKLRKKFKNV